MGSCTRRHFLLSICTLQLLLTIQRQLFDFLGFMWAPILANFFHFIFVIFGFFGAYQYRAKYLISYSIWNILWIGWNTFIICFYSNVGKLDRDSDLLNLGTGSVSWFEVNGYGCRPTYPTNITQEIDPYRPLRPESVDGCLLDYYIIEIIQAGLQCLLAILGVIGSICIGRIFLDEDDSLSRNGIKSKHRQSMYSVEFGPPVDAIRGRSRDDLSRSDNLSPKPMTPRRIKRRSMARGSTSRTSTQSRRSHGNRSSTRNSRRKVHQNPVTKLMEQQNSKTFTNYQTRPSGSDLTVSNLKSLNNDYITAPGPSSTRSASDFRHSPDPIYYNMNASAQQQPVNWDSSSAQSPAPPLYSQGHSNPTYQHSTPNLSHSPEPPDEPYSNRPPSVRSSYSNFHGSRPLSSYNPTTGTKENVFLGLNQQPPPTHPKPYAHVQPQAQAVTAAQQSQPAAPQLPAKNLNRQIPREPSTSSLAFLNSGPPAYNLNYHTPPDSETTM